MDDIQMAFKSWIMEKMAPTYVASHVQCTIVWWLLPYPYPKGITIWNNLHNMDEASKHNYQSSKLQVLPSEVRIPQLLQFGLQDGLLLSMRQVLQEAYY